MIVAIDTNVIVAAYAWWDDRQDAAAIAHVAREGGAEAILTFNARHFWGEGLKVLTP